MVVDEVYDNEKMKKRNSSIELVRILFAIGVVFLHYNGNAIKYVDRYSVNYIWILVTEALSVGAVDFFVMISGYYLSRSNDRRFVKVVELLLQAILFNLAFYIGSIVIGNDELSVSGIICRLIPENYFVVLYCVVYVMSPYINIVLERLSDSAFKKLVLSSLVIFSVLSYVNDILAETFGSRFLMANPISVSGSSAGCNIASFMLLYIIGAFIARSDIKAEGYRGYFLCFAMLMAIIIVSIVYSNSEVNLAWGYNSPFIIVLVATIIVVFKDSTYSSRLINELSGAAYTCYLFHGNFLAFLGIGGAATRSLPVLILHQIFVGIGLYLLSYFVYKIYGFCTSWLISLLAPVCDRVNISVDNDSVSGVGG